ncbi:hypothetical protein [Pantoea sp. 1.19]|uniref:hypothetical protein n=1 Tax=Pantoea sp. 1.19 TaxID=1925589 RepID=UPI000948CA01|nr:hypothetical protein [Pantoea sp. 1.19]
MTASESREEVIAAIEQRAAEILRHPKIDTALLSHFYLLVTLCKSKPLYFKTLFKTHRFLLCLILLHRFHTSSTPSIKGLKAHCLRLGLVSKNTVDAFIGFLHAGKRLQLTPDADDRRCLQFAITAKAQAETAELLLSLIAPFGTLFPDSQLLQGIGDGDFVARFFTRYARVLRHDIFIKDLLSAGQSLLSRDAGHMMLFYVFSEAVRAPRAPLLINYQQAASVCGVSRAHLRRFLAACRAEGLLHTDADTRGIVLSARFLTLVRRYFALYLASMEVAFSADEALPAGRWRTNCANRAAPVPLQ